MVNNVRVQTVDAVMDAMRSLPWYLGGAVLIVPLAGAPFTGGWSLSLYILYFMSPSLLVIPLCAGALLWIIRQFFRFAMVAHVSRY